MDVWSLNFYAEVLGKYLGARAAGPPGSIAKGAAAIRSLRRAPTASAASSPTMARACPTRTA